MKLIMCKGLPGSGKSTWAKQMLKDFPGQYKRINRDDLRGMIDGGKWSRTNEEFIKKIRDLIISKALIAGFDVIVDDLNLDPKLENWYRDMARDYVADFEIKDFTDVDKDLCIKRDLERPNSVGSKVINKWYNQYIAKKEDIVSQQGVPDAIICDIDGTLALFGNANPYERDFTKDDLNRPVFDILCSFYDPNVKIILLSGRKDKFRQQTEQWLNENAVPYNFLYMRKGEDERKDSIVKRELFDEYIRGKYNVLFVLDDRDQVVQMWRNMGLTCLQVNYGDF